MRKILIEWKHYDKQGETCSRCNNTGDNVKAAIGTICSEFKDVKISYKETRLAADKMAESNSIFINGQAIEDLLEATASENFCHSCTCLSGKGSNCRTIELDGNSYEAIPEELILKALRLVVGRENNR